MKQENIIYCGMKAISKPKYEYEDIWLNAESRKLMINTEVKKWMLKVFNDMSDKSINHPIFEEHSIKVYTLLHVCKGYSIEQFRPANGKKHYIFVNDYETIEMEEPPKRMSFFDGLFGNR